MYSNRAIIYLIKTFAYIWYKKANFYTNNFYTNYKDLYKL